MGLLSIDSANSESLMMIEEFKKAINEAEKKKCRIIAQLLGFLNDFGVSVLPSEDVAAMARKKIYNFWAENERKPLSKEQLDKLRYWTVLIRHAIAAQLQRRSEREFKPKKHKVIHTAAVEEGDYLID